MSCKALIPFIGVSYSLNVTTQVDSL